VYDLDVTFDGKVSRRDFLKFLAAGATTLAFGSVLGFSSFFAANKNGRSGIGSGGGIGGGGIQQAAAQSAPGIFVLGPNTGKISVHAANLPNGKIFYAAGSGFSSTYENGPYHWNIFDPATGSITNHTVAEDIFCMGQAVLPNGKVLCAGGTLEYDVGDNPDGVWKGLASAFEYDPSSNSLTKVQSMKHGRWYPYCIVLEDGKVLTIGGFDEWGSDNALAEIYNPSTKSWSIKYDSTTSNTYCVGWETPSAPPGLPCYGGSNQGTMPYVSLYPRAIFMPTGLVAVAGQSKTTRTWNPQTGKWTFAGNLSVARSYGNMVLLPLNNTTSEKGQLLVCGGSNTSGENATTVVQLLTPNPSTNYTTFTFQTIASCNFARRHAPNAYLPNGKLIFFGGTNFQNTSSGAYKNAEIFDPVAKSWTVVSGMIVPRIYHSTGILLLDGRVWLAGSSYSKSNWELRSEYYVPSYYNATRPTISSNPTVGNYGGTINIPTPNAAGIGKVSLIRLSTFTHGFNSDLRFIWLQIQSKGSSSVTVSAPVNAKIAPPGYYMIHVLNSAGVPSKAKVIKIPGTSSGGGGGTYTTIYSQPGNISYITLGTGANHRAGEIMTSASTLIGNSIKKLTVILKKAGNPTGTITVRVRKGTADSVAITFGTIQATSLTTTDQTFTLEAPTSHTFAANDKVLVEWAGTGTSTDQVLVKRHNYTDPAASFDGINTKQSHKLATSTGYSSYSNADMAGQWSKLG
jgi:hypothetical protein